MKLSFIGNLGESDVRFATDNGFDGIEVLYSRMTDAERGLAAKEQQVLRDSSLEVCALGLWRINFCDPDPATREANLQQLRLCIDHAADLGCSIVYTGTGVVEENNDEANVAEYLKVFPAMVEYAASKGVRLGHYLGHEASMIRSMAVWDMIKDEVPQVGLKLDPMGLIRNLEENPVEVLYKYGDRLLHFHIKDRMDVADVASEREHGYRVDAPLGTDLPKTFMAMHGNLSGPVVDGGRRVLLAESWTASVRPGRDAVIVMRTVPGSSPGLSVRASTLEPVSVAMPPGQESWAEWVLMRVPGERLIDSELPVETRPAPGRWFSSFHYWVYQKR